jgi:hypothetical protein
MASILFSRERVTLRNPGASHSIRTTCSEIRNIDVSMGPLKENASPRFDLR